MFFILSKIFYFFLNPFVWILILIIAAFFLKSVHKKKLSLRLAIIFSLVFSNTVLYLECVRFWEIDGQKIEAVGEYDIAVVLGGMAQYNTDLNRLSLSYGGDRIWQAIQLYHAGKVKKILISGSHGNLIDKGLNEALQFKQDLIKQGIPESDILVEAHSKNTYENAVETKKLIDNLNYKPSILLVTSALHMKRALACFKKVGFNNIDVFTTNHFTGKTRNYFFDQYIIPNSNTMFGWKFLLKEWVGYIAYWVMCYI